MKPDLITIKLDKPHTLPYNVHRCIRCGGTGRGENGWISMSETEIKIQPASQCGLCEGSGLVQIFPYNSKEK